MCKSETRSASVKIPFHAASVVPYSGPAIKKLWVSHQKLNTLHKKNRVCLTSGRSARKETVEHHLHTVITIKSFELRRPPQSKHTCKWRIDKMSFRADEAAEQTIDNRKAAATSLSLVERRANVTADSPFSMRSPHFLDHVFRLFAYDFSISARS